MGDVFDQAGKAFKLLRCVFMAQRGRIVRRELNAGKIATAIIIAAMILG
jgi:hypothetical protein